MRIAMLGEHTDVGTAPVTDLSATLSAQGHDVTAHHWRDDPAARSGAGWASDRPDVVHNHSWVTAPAATAAARHGIPVVHSFRPHQGSGRWADVARVLADATDRLTTTCNAHAEALVTAGVPRSRISVVPDGVDVDLFTPEGPVEPARSPRRLVALGDQAPHAGFSTAIAALPALPGTELVIAGEATVDLRHYGNGLGVADRVHFTGPLTADALSALLRSADVAVCTPWHEPCRAPVLEAMACGLAVVASTVGPLPDIVVDKVTGLLVPPHRPRALADALHRLLTRHITREQYGATGRDRVSARYSWQRIATELIHVYERAGAAPAARPRSPRVRRGRPIGAWQ